jgi:hypothetical protein
MLTKPAVFNSTAETRVAVLRNTHKRFGEWSGGSPIVRLTMVSSLASRRSLFCCESLGLAAKRAVMREMNSASRARFSPNMRSHLEKMRISS